MAKLVQFLFAVIALVALCADAATVPTIYVSPSGTYTAPSASSLLSTPRHPIPQPLLARRQRLVDRWFAYQGLGGGERNRGGAAPHPGRRGASGTLALWRWRDQDGERGCRHLHPLEHARPHRRRQQHPLHRRGTVTPLRLWWITATILIKVFN